MGAGYGTIPLMYQPPQVKDPMTAYGQMLQLKNMQMQQQQATQMNPLLLQQQQAATRMEQMRLQQAQLQIQYQQNLNQEFQNYAHGTGDYAPTAPTAQPQGAAPPADAPAAAPSLTDNLTPSTAATPPPAAAPYAATSLAVNNDPTNLTNGLTPVAAPYASLSPAPPRQAITPKMYDTAPVKPGADASVAGFDPMVPLNRALQKGAIPFAYYQQAAEPILKMRQSYAAMNEAELKAQNARDESYYGRLMGFLKQPGDYQAQNWSDFNYQAYKDGALSPRDFQSVQQHFPQLPDPATLDHLRMEFGTRVGAQNWAINNQKLQNEQLTGQKTQADITKAQAELPGVQAKAEQEQMADAAQKLLNNSDSYEAYDSTKQAIAAKNPAIAAQFPEAADVFDENGKPRPEQIQALQRRGQNTEQQTTTDIARIRATNLAAHQKVMEGQGQERNNIARIRANNANANRGGVNALYQRLATTAYNNLAQSSAFAGKQPTWDDVIASVRDQNNYRDEDTNAPEMDANRAGVVQYIQNVKKGQLGNTRTQYLIDNPPVRGGGFNPLVRHADGTWRAQPAAPKPATPAPQTTPATPSNPSQPQHPATPSQWTIAGRAYKVGDPISIHGKKYTFQGLDPNGKVLAIPQ